MCVGLVLFRTGLVGVSTVMGRQFRAQGCQTLALPFVVDLVGSPPGRSRFLHLGPDLTGLCWLNWLNWSPEATLGGFLNES